MFNSLIEEEYDTFTRGRSWPVIYTRIKNEASIVHRDFPIKVARLPQNRDRNRYRDVSPYDDYRVKLEDSENDYINASLVQVPLSKRTYILTQGPLERTACHFWLMVWQKKSTGVLMLNKIVENGRLKCHLYYPMGSQHHGDDVMDFPETGIRVEFMEVDDFSYFVKRTLKLINTKTEEERIVYQFHYTAWPDFDVPQSSEAFLGFLYAVRSSGAISDQSQPPVIHCSAGIGRSGTFCLVDSALVIVEKTKSMAALDIRSMLLDMRQYRCGLIQTHDQLRFSYMAIIDGAHQIINGTSNHEQPPPITHPPPEDITPDSSEVSDEDDDEEEDEDVEPEGDSNDECESIEDLDTIPNGNLKPEFEDAVPEPPTRTTSLGTTLIPEPPNRTSSLLQKAQSLDQEVPPAVPPRPPPRQMSVPAVISHPEVKDDEDDAPQAPPLPTKQSPIAQKREEKRRKTQAIIDKMKANQAAANIKPIVDWSRYMWMGAGLAVTAAVAFIYMKN